MKIAIATVQVPFVRGGAEILAEMLRDELIKRGHNAQIVSFPFKWYPQSTLLQCIQMGRMIDLTESQGEKIDKVIALKFPAYLLKHENKVLWLLHQHRTAYDLWETKFGDMHLWENGEEIKKLIYDIDNKYLPEFKNIFTIAQCTTDRLKKYNNINSTVLYHPPLNYEKLHCEDYKDYFFYPSRVNIIKRQRLLVEAMAHVKSNVKAIIAGGGEESEINHLKDLITKHHLEDKVQLVGFISEEEKIKYYANSLGVYFGAYNEDYGYITLESFYSHKPVIVHKDAGGPLEFVKDNENGFVVDDTPQAIAEKLDYLYENKDKAKEFGDKGRQLLDDKNINWDFVIEKLLGE